MGVVDLFNCLCSIFCNWGLRIFIEVLLGLEVIICDVIVEELFISVWIRFVWFWFSNIFSGEVVVLVFVEVLIFRLELIFEVEVTVLVMTEVVIRLVVSEAVEFEEGDICGRMEFVVISNFCCIVVCFWIFKLFWGVIC